MLTGNSEAIARQKLTTFGLAGHLELDAGAYGDARAERADLLLLAWENQRRLRGGSFRPKHTWVSDTPRDMPCARAHGARCLLVATGQYALSELAPLGGEAVVADFSDGPRVKSALGLSSRTSPDSSSTLYRRSSRRRPRPGGR